MSWQPALLSLGITGPASLLILGIGLALALLLARRRFPGKLLVDTLLTLPLVLPPSVVGYYLLRALGRGSPLFEWLGLRLLFTPAAAVVAATIVGLPLMVQSAQAAIAGVDPQLENAARTLGSGELAVFRRVTLPLAIYDAVQNRRYDAATQMVLLVTSVSFLALYLIRRLEHPRRPGPLQDAGP
jgi:molybdate transport system permease protein